MASAAGRRVPACGIDVPDMVAMPGSLPLAIIYIYGTVDMHADKLTRSMHGFIRSLAADPVIDRGHHQIISLWLINYPALGSTTYAIDM